MFDTFLKDLNEQGGSVRAYDGCARAARARIAAEPENAAALLLIAYAAQRFVEAYDDQPLSIKAAGEELEIFSDMVNTLDRAHKGGSAEEKLAALNAVAARLAAQIARS
ncbi:hypothetical protein [Nitratireductor sp. ZSWI3]|uniref:hypothetical protein n=1 Tax=Nitratireductor sp. ZSWI3 TaxID=2966359 RepID=UPI00215044B8|nr:hypothetical protein [Nitratireductor sp. ZSWI3]MCR4268455.1 hypothetical protein [Nitratireductor sp. ZSWI3]